MFWNNFVNLCNNKGKSPTAVISELGISRGSVTHWRTGKVPHHNTLLKIADYFNVSVDYLLGKENAPDVKSNAIILDPTKTRMIPVYESVSAGFGTLAQDLILEYMPIYIHSESEAAETICIKVQGDSMSPKIENGDTIQVHKQTSVDSGSIAVVLVDGEDALVKNVIYGPNFIELHSFNPEYQTIRFEGADVMRVQVIGLVKKIVKNATGTTKRIKLRADSAAMDRAAALVRQLNDGELDQLDLLIDFIISQRKK
jgi:repressor LexA